MSDARVSGSTLGTRRTENTVWLELNSDGKPLARVNIVRALWYAEHRPDNLKSASLPMTDAQLNVLIDKAIPL